MRLKKKKSTDIEHLTDFERAIKNSTCYLKTFTMLNIPIFFVIVQIFVISLHNSVAQTNSNGCSKYLTNVHRRGPNVQGRLEIPTDNFYPRYKLKVAFSSPIHHLAIRQSRAKDTGSHREFVIDPMEMRREGKLSLDIFIRLRGILGPMTRMTRIVYNNVALCGDSVDFSEMDHSFVTEITTEATNPTTTAAVLIPSNGTTQSWKIKDYGEEEEDIF